MASLGHVAVGLAAARWLSRHPGVSYRRALVNMLVASLWPDLDVIGFAIGVQYGDPWGHRGASHSLALAALLGVVMLRGARHSQLPALRVGLCAAVVAASHGLLDALTDGGLGVAFFWPMSETRYFLPWRPIPVAPIGVAFFSTRGLSVALWELLCFLPFFVYGVWPRRAAAPPPATLAPPAA